MARDYSDLSDYLSSGPKTAREIQEEFELSNDDIGNLVKRAVAMKIAVRVNPPKSILVKDRWHRDYDHHDLWVSGKIERMIGALAFNDGTTPQFLLTFLLVLMNKAIENFNPRPDIQEDMVEKITAILHEHFLDKYDTRTVEEIL